MRNTLKVFLLFAAAAASACGSGDESSSNNAAETTAVTTTTVAVTVPPTTPPTTVPPAPTTTVPVLMPAIPCGTDLQVAQDRVQEAGVMYSRSEDATGQGRNQVIDNNWTVLRQSPPAGTPIQEGDPVFYVVKDEEFRGC